MNEDDVTTLHDVLAKPGANEGLAVRVIEALQIVSQPIKDPEGFRKGIDRPKVFSPETSIQHLKERSEHIEMLAILMEGHGEYGLAAARLRDQIEDTFVYLANANKGLVDRRGILTAVDNIDLFNLEYDNGEIRPIMHEGRAVMCRTVNQLHGFWGALSNLLARATEKQPQFADELILAGWDSFADYFDIGEDEARQATVACFTYGVTCLIHYLFEAAAKVAEEKDEELGFEHFLEVDEQSLMLLLVNYRRTLDGVFVTL